MRLGGRLVGVREDERGGWRTRDDLVPLTAHGGTLLNGLGGLSRGGDGHKACREDGGETHGGVGY